MKKAPSEGPMPPKGKGPGLMIVIGASPKKGKGPMDMPPPPDDEDEMAPPPKAKKPPVTRGTKAPGVMGKNGMVRKPQPPNFTSEYQAKPKMGGKNC